MEAAARKIWKEDPVLECIARVAVLLVVLPNSSNAIMLVMQCGSPSSYLDGI
jgi:hypothetical protein